MKPIFSGYSLANALFRRGIFGGPSALAWQTMSRVGLRQWLLGAMWIGFAALLPAFGLIPGFRLPKHPFGPDVVPGAPTQPSESATNDEAETENTAAPTSNETAADAGPPSETVSGENVVVSLTFDDGFASQAIFLDLLDELGLDSIKATFFVNTSRLNLEINERDSRDHVRYAPLDVWLRAARGGHEIGAHSVSHLDLTCTEQRFAEESCQPGHKPLTAEERRRQICADGQMLRSLGFDVRGFAYPFGRDRTAEADDTLHQLVARCGYEYGRRTGGLKRGASGSGVVPLAETIPPQEIYGIRSYGSVTRDVRFEDMQRWVLDASERGGGWVPLIFHHISDDCSEPDDPARELGVCILRDELEAFLRWLGRVDGGQSAPRNVQVQLMGDVVARGIPEGVLLVANSAMEQAHNGSIERPNCYDRFEGKHDGNFDWSSEARERQRDPEQTQPESAFAGISGRFEKLIPSARYPKPLVRMTTRDDQCYLPVSPSGRYQARLRARAISSDGQPVTARFSFRLLRIEHTPSGTNPVWFDWQIDSPVQTVSDSEWEWQTLELPQLPSDAVALALGYQYLAPAFNAGTQHELWIDDFSLTERRSATE